MPVSGASKRLFPPCRAAEWWRATGRACWQGRGTHTGKPGSSIRGLSLSLSLNLFLSLCPIRQLQLIKVAGREGNLIAIFHEEHSRVLQQLQVFTFFPESLPASRKPFERKTMDRQSARKPLLGLVSGGVQARPGQQRPLCPRAGHLARFSANGRRYHTDINEL